jgi:RNA polymerase sigma factor (sigma-70 family)
MVKETYVQLALKFKKTKCKKTFKKLYEKILPGLRSYVYKIVKNWDHTDDITAITMAKVYTKIDDFDTTYQITTWAYKIAKNEALQLIKKNSKVVSLNVFSDNGYEVDNNKNLGISDVLPTNDISILSDEDLIEQENSLQSQYENLINEILNLNVMYRQIMIDRYINKLSYKEIEEKNNRPYLEICKEKRAFIKELLETGKDEEALEEKMKLKRFISNKMINQQTIKNRIIKGKSILKKSLIKK